MPVQGGVVGDEFDNVFEDPSNPERNNRLEWFSAPLLQAEDPER